MFIVESLELVKFEPVEFENREDAFEFAKAEAEKRNEFVCVSDGYRITDFFEGNRQSLSF